MGDGTAGRRTHHQPDFWRFRSRIEALHAFFRSRRSVDGDKRLAAGTPIRVQSFLKGEDMGKRRGQRKGYLRPEHGSWLLTYYVYDQTGRSHRETVKIGPASGPGKLTGKQAERFAWDHYLSKVDQAVLQPRSMMSVAEYWERYYKPAALRSLTKSAREQYFSLYTTWIEPVIGRKRLAVLEAADVEHTMAQALEAGRSGETAWHIRKVISAIYSRAKRDNVASGDNPAQLADAPRRSRVRRKIALSFDQMQSVLALMPENVRTMGLTAVITSANISELLGLSWKHMNLTPEWATLDNDALAPFTIAIRQHFTRGEYGPLKTGNRKRNIPIPEQLVAALAQLKQKARFTGPDDVVFASRRGTPLSQNNLRNRTLKKIAKQLELPGLSWHTFRYSHANFTESIEMHARDRQALMGHGSIDMTDRYTEEDRERIRNGLEKIAERIVPDKKRIQ